MYPGIRQNPTAGYMANFDRLGRTNIRGANGKMDYTPMLSRPQQPRIHLHIFVDASENAYAAVGYFRVGDDEEVTCVLVSA